MAAIVYRYVRGLIRKYRLKLKFLLAVVGLWVCIIVYVYLQLLGVDYVIIDDSDIKEMQTRPNHPNGFGSYIYRPLGGAPVLTYYSLPVKELVPGVLYTEVTSANRNVRKSLQPDFTYHIESVTLYEHHGAGCLNRLYLYPSLPRDFAALDSLTAANMTASYVSITIDDHTYTYTVSSLMLLRDTPPFVTPISMRHKHPVSGLTVYMHMCYSQYVKVVYEHDSDLPPHLVQEMMRCGDQELTCPVQIYSAVTGSRSPAGMPRPASNYNDEEGRRVQQSHIRILASLLSSPKIPTPEKSSCSLFCQQIKPGNSELLYQHNSSSGVINSILMRVYSSTTYRQVNNWNYLTITIEVDDLFTFRNVSMALLFGVSASLNPSRSSIGGKYEAQTCNMNHMYSQVLPRVDVTPYLLTPMPFWHRVRVHVYLHRRADESLIVCHDISTVRNHYNRERTGYLKSQQYLYSDDIFNTKVLLSTKKKRWGKVVSVQLNVDNLKARKEGVSRWALLQSDINTYIDASTGLEDYFGYAHGFSREENTSHSFAGVYHATEVRVHHFDEAKRGAGAGAGLKRSYRGLQYSMSWHCYRNHILDSLFYRQSIRIEMEAALRRRQRNATTVERGFGSLSYEEYYERLATKRGTMASLVLYYEGTTGALVMIDKINIGTIKSEKEHRFNITHCSKDCSPISVKASYVGDSTELHRNARTFNDNDAFSFKIKVPNLSTKDFLVRRDSLSNFDGPWYASATLLISSASDSVTLKWASPKNSGNDYVHQSDRSVRLSHRGSIRFTVRPTEQWIDLSYTVYAIL